MIKVGGMMLLLSEDQLKRTNTMDRERERKKNRNETGSHAEEGRLQQFRYSLHLYSFCFIFQDAYYFS